MNKLTIFISYAREDKEKIQEIYQYLKQKGYHPWLDEKELSGGDQWEHNINQAINDSDLFLACLSKASVNKRGYVQKELRKALEILEEFPEDGSYLIPIRLEECSIPTSLARIQWVDLFRPDGYEKLNNSIRTYINHRNEKDLDSKEAPPVFVPAVFLSPFTFINREHEMEEIRNPGSSELIVLNAPTGYGKSRLLEEIEDWYGKEKGMDWACARVKINSEQYKEIPNLILKEVSLQAVGKPIESTKSEKVIEKIVEQKKHIILMFDEAELNLKAIQWLQKHFITPLKEVLKQTTLIGRVVFAGRYLQRPDLDWNNYRIINLTVLSESVVRQAVFVELERTSLKSETKKILAKELASISCGHPGIISEILQSRPRGSWALAVKGNEIKSEIRKDIFTIHVKHVVDDILSEIKDENLREILKILSVFRRFDLNYIQALKTLAREKIPIDTITCTFKELTGHTNFIELLEPFASISENPMNLLMKLVCTGLISGPTMEKKYYHDSIIRNLILKQMQMEGNKRRFHSLNSLAFGIYNTWIDGKRVNGSKLLVPPVDDLQINYMVESLYHILICFKDEKRSESYCKIISKIEWYIEKLSSGFGYDKPWLQLRLKETIQLDENVSDLLLEMFRRSKIQKIFKKIISKSSARK